MSYREQRKLVLFAILVALPSSLSECSEISSLMSVREGAQEQQALSLVQLDERLAGRLVGPVMWAALLAQNVLSQSVRLYPLTSLTYSAMCMSRHLKSIHGQMRSLHASSTSSASRKSAPLEECAHLGDGDAEAKPTNIQLVYSGLSGPRSAPEPLVAAASRPNRLSPAKASLEARLATRASQLERSLSRGSATASATSASLSLQACPEDARSSDGDQLALQSLVSDGSEWGARVDIGDIRALERHLTKLSLLAADIDRSSAALAFAMTSLSLFQVFYSLFLLVNFWSASRLALLRAALECASRLISPFVLFMASESMEREAARLVVRLEVMYLQNSSKALIQRKYGATMSSLMRVFRGLRALRFTCDNLLAINLGTIKRLLFYSLTIMFIVVQYGE